MNIWKEHFRHYNFDRSSKGIITAPTNASLLTVCIQHSVVAEVCIKEMKQCYHKAPCLCLMTSLLGALKLFPQLCSSPEAFLSGGTGEKESWEVPVM